MDYVLRNIDISVNISELNIKADITINNNTKYNSLRNFHVKCPKKQKKWYKYRGIFSMTELTNDIILYFKPNCIIHTERYIYQKYTIGESHLIDILSSNGEIYKECCFIYYPNDIATKEINIRHLLVNAPDVNRLK